MTATDERDYAEEAANQALLDDPDGEAEAQDLAEMLEGLRVEKIREIRERVARAARHRRHQEDGVKARLAARTDAAMDSIQQDVDRIATHRTAAEVLEVVLAGTNEDEEIPARLPLDLLLEVVNQGNATLPMIRGAAQGAAKLDAILRGE